MKAITLLVLCCALSHAQSATPLLVYPNGLALDKQGNLYISDIGTHQILKLTRDGRLTVFAGVGEPGFAGDGGPASQARFFAPHDITFDPDGNLLVADSLNHRIRRIDSRGIISTIAGTGVSGYSGDGGPASQAQFNGPQAINVDPKGNLLVADTYNHVARRIDRSGIITTFAGKEPGLSGDGGLATEARISLPTDVGAAPDGAVYVADSGNSRIRRIGVDGIIQTIAGSGTGSGLGGAGFAGDSGPAERAKLFSPASLQLGGSGALYISDTGNNRIRVIREGAITTVAGSGDAGFRGDDGAARIAILNTPQKIRLAPDGSLCIADRGNGRVRLIDNAGVIRTVAGSGPSPKP
jgi:sugar lactone lactonase YvrE